MGDSMSLKTRIKTKSIKATKRNLITEMICLIDMISEVYNRKSAGEINSCARKTKTKKQIKQLKKELKTCFCKGKIKKSLSQNNLLYEKIHTFIMFYFVVK